MRRPMLISAALALIVTAAYAQQIPDSDGDGIPDDAEWRLGSDPEHAEELEVVYSSPVGEAGDTSPRLDLGPVWFGNVGRDRWLFALQFADDFRFENCWMLVYIDSDNDQATGRPQLGNDYYWMIHGEERAYAVSYGPDGKRGEAPDPRVVVEGRRVYLCGDMPIVQQDGRSHFRLQISVATREPVVVKDFVAFTHCEGPPNSDRPPGGGNATVRGIVLGPRGAPVPDANVRAFAMPEDGVGDPFAPSAATVSDEEGRFELSVPGGMCIPSADAGTLALGVDAGASAPPWQLVAGVLRDEVELRLADGGTVTGRVTGPDGEPAAGAEIAGDLGYLATTGDDGRFTIEAMPPGERRLLARVDGLVGTAAPLVTAGVTTSVELGLAPSITVRGTVTSEVTGEPVAGALVELRTDADRGLLNAVASAVTGPDGAYAISGLPAGWITGDVSISHDDFPDQVHGILEPDPEDRAIEADFALHAGYAVEGRVLLPDGTPAVGALVRLGPYRGFDAAGAEETNAQGRFRLDGLEDSYQQVLSTELESYAPAAMLLKPGRGEGIPQVELTLQPGHTYTGRLLDPDGDPWPHQEIQAMITVDDHVTEVGHFTRTDDTGLWTYPDLPAEGAFIRRRVGSLIVEMPISLDAENLYRTPALGVIAGQVVTADGGQPVPQFEVTVLPGDAGGDEQAITVSEFYARPWAFEDAGGQFRLQQMPLGVPMRLTVRASGYEAATVGPIEAGAEGDERWPVTIELNSG